jgi:hypothetical protein
VTGRADIEIYPVDALLLDVEESECVGVFFPEGTLAERAV